MTAAGPGDDGRNELPAALDSGRRHPAVGEQLPALVQTFGGDVRFNVDQGRNHARSITLACPLFLAPPRWSLREGRRIFPSSIGSEPRHGSGDTPVPIGYDSVRYVTIY